uniref:Uncharacterized protein n=1 Tax=Knipowitschia caucasica TaxID=637954 RepID=A0AAV2KHP8_KNICA
MKDSLEGEMLMIDNLSGSVFHHYSASPPLCKCFKGHPPEVLRHQGAAAGLAHSTRNMASSELLMPLSSSCLWAPHASELLMPLGSSCLWAPHASELLMPLGSSCLWAPHASELLMPLSSSCLWAPHASELLMPLGSSCLCWLLMPLSSSCL